MLNDDIRTRLEGYRFAERRLDLLRNVVGIEYRLVLRIEFDCVLTFGSNQTDIVENLRIGLRIIDKHIFKRRTEYVANNAHSAAVFLMKQSRRSVLLQFLDGLFPAFHQCVHLIVELCHPFVFGRCPHNHTEIFRLDAFNELT